MVLLVGILLLLEDFNKGILSPQLSSSFVLKGFLLLFMRQPETIVGQAFLYVGAAQESLTFYLQMIAFSSVKLVLRNVGYWSKSSRIMRKPQVKKLIPRNPPFFLAPIHLKKSRMRFLLLLALCRILDTRVTWAFHPSLEDWRNKSSLFSKRGLDKS